MKTFAQSTGDRLDYVFDWSAQLTLDGDTISSAAFTLSSGITADGTSNSDTDARIWLRDGVEGTHQVTCEITTVGGRVYSRSIQLTVLEL